MRLDQERAGDARDFVDATGNRTIFVEAIMTGTRLQFLKCFDCSDDRAMLVVNGNGANPIAYGAGKNPDALYVGSGSQVFARLKAGDPLSETAPLPGVGPGPVSEVQERPTTS